MMKRFFILLCVTLVLGLAAGPALAAAQDPPANRSGEVEFPIHHVTPSETERIPSPTLSGLR